MVEYRLELLEEYAVLPELKNTDEAGLKEFLAQMNLRKQKAKEVPEDVFSLDYRYFEMEMDGIHMGIQLESRFGYIGGGASGKNISKFHKIYKERYYYFMK